MIVNFLSHFITIHAAVALHPWSIDTIVIIVIPFHCKDDLLSSTDTLFFVDWYVFPLFTVYYVRGAVFGY